MPIPTRGGSIPTAGGVLRNTPLQVQAEYDEVDDFNGYSGGQALRDETGDWNGDGNFRTEDTSPIEGTIELRGRFPDNTREIGSLATNGLPNYPFADCTIRYNVKFETTGFAGFAFGVPDTANSDASDQGYRVHVGPDTEDGSSAGNTLIVKRVDDVVTVLAENTDTVSAGVILEPAISFVDTGSEIQIDLSVWEWDGSSWSEFTTLSATDTDRDFTDQDGGIGMMYDNGVSDDNIDWDNIRRSTTPNAESQEPTWTPS